MSVLSKCCTYLYLYMYISTTLGLGNNTEDVQYCMSPDEEEKMEKMKFTIEMKDKQIAHLSRQLAMLKSHRVNTKLTDDPEFSTCNDVRPDLHLKRDKQCVFECMEPNACSDTILSCYPYDNCVVKCEGHGSCTHLQIDFTKGKTKLTCNGFQSCKGIVMNALEKYEYDDGIVNRGHAVKYDPNDEDEQPFWWYLPDLKFDFKDAREFQDDDVILNPHYILAKNVLTEEMRERIEQSYEICFDEEHTEHREFGGGYGDIEGHSVTFLDDCVHHLTYRDMKNITMGLIKYIQQYHIREFERENITNNDVDAIKGYITDNWLYDWQTMISLSNKLEARVIEYIHYTVDGNLGWHTDDDSNFTLVAALNDASSYNGGVLNFRLNMWDETEYSIRLQQNDVIIFPSIADHSVEPVSNGERRVLVFEWWDIGRSVRVGRTSPYEHLDDMEDLKRNRRKKPRERGY